MKNKTNLRNGTSHWFPDSSPCTDLQILTETDITARRKDSMTAQLSATSLFKSSMQYSKDWIPGLESSKNNTSKLQL